MKTPAQFFLGLALALLAIVSLAVRAEAAPCEMPRPEQTISSYFNECEAGGKTKIADFTKDKKAATAQEVKAANNPAAPADGFAERVSGTISDFLPFFQFAVDAVNTAEDQKSVTVKFNDRLLSPQFGALALQATVTEPEISETLLQEVAEPARASQKEALAGKLGDFADITVSGTWGYQRSDQGKNLDWNHPARLWGRDPALYDGVVEDIMVAVVENASDKDMGAEQRKLRAQRFKGESKIASALGIDTRGDKEWKERVTFGEIQQAINTSKLAQNDYDDYLKALREYASALGRFADRFVSGPNLDDIAPLIDNQPQLVLTGSYRERDQFVGPPAWAATFKLEMGSRNLNTVRSEYARLAEESRIKGTQEEDPQHDLKLRYQAFENVIKNNLHRRQNKLIVTASYKGVSSYKLDYPYKQTVTDPASGQDVILSRLASVDVDKSHELEAKAQWTCLVPALQFGGAGAAATAAAGAPGSVARELIPRFTLTAEYTDVTGDPNRQDRLIAMLEYSMPIRGGMAIPVTLTYANHSKFLSGQDKQLSAHIALSYRH